MKGSCRILSPSAAEWARRTARTTEKKANLAILCELLMINLLFLELDALGDDEIVEIGWGCIGTR
jgi:hypothetical protein